MLDYIIIGIIRLCEWAAKQPERQLAFFGSDKFAYSLMGGSVAIVGLFALVREVLV